MFSSTITGPHNPNSLHFCEPLNRYYDILACWRRTRTKSGKYGPRALWSQFYMSLGILYVPRVAALPSSCPPGQPPLGHIGSLGTYRIVTRVPLGRIFRILSSSASSRPICHNMYLCGMRILVLSVQAVLALRIYFHFLPFFHLYFSICPPRQCWYWRMPKKLFCHLCKYFRATSIVSGKSSE